MIEHKCRNIRLIDAYSLWNSAKNQEEYIVNLNVCSMYRRYLWIGILDGQNRFKEIEL